MNHDRLEAIYDYLRNQLTESSTVRAVITLLTMAGGTLAKLPIDVTLTTAMIVSQVLKLAMPDDLPHWRLPWKPKEPKP